MDNKIYIIGIVDVKGRAEANRPILGEEDQWGKVIVLYFNAREEKLEQLIMKNKLPSHAKVLKPHNVTFLPYNVTAFPYKSKIYIIDESGLILICNIRKRKWKYILSKFNISRGFLSETDLIIYDNKNNLYRVEDNDSSNTLVKLPYNHPLYNIKTFSISKIISGGIYTIFLYKDINLPDDKLHIAVYNDVSKTWRSDFYPKKYYPALSYDDVGLLTKEYRGIFYTFHNDINNESIVLFDPETMIFTETEIIYSIPHGLNEIITLKVA